MYGQSETNQGNGAIGGTSVAAFLSEKQSASLGNINKQVERAPIDVGMSALQDRIESLHRAVSMLEQRFSPVLRSTPPQAPGSSPRPIEVMAGSPVGSLLSDRVGQLRDVETRIEDLLGRCEL